MDLFYSLIAIIGVTLAVGWWIKNVYRHKKNPSHTYAENWNDPLKQWSRCAWGIVTGGVDYAATPSHEVADILNAWGLQERIQWEHYTDTLLACDDNNAWDLIRYMNLMRMGVAVHYISNDMAWENIRIVRERLQQQYTNWQEMADAYVERRTTEYSETIDAEMTQNIQKLGSGLWREVPFK